MTHYDELLFHLFSIRDEKYKQFHQGLVPNSNEIIGVKIPVLDSIAKELAKADYIYYMEEYYNRVNSCETIYFEEDILIGKLIGHIPCDYKTFTNNLWRFAPRVTNWSVCDTLCSNLKPVKKFKKDFFEHITRYLGSDNPWNVRIGLVIMLDWYIDDTYIDEVLNRTYAIRNDFYYIEMAQAWLLATAYAKCRDKTHTFLLSKPPISDSVLKKTLQKIRDSRRVSKEDKVFLTNHFTK